MRRERKFLMCVVALVTIFTSGCGIVDHVEMGAKYDFVGDGNPIEGNLKIGFNRAETVKEKRPVLTGDLDGEKTKFYAFTEDETAVIMQSLEKSHIKESDNVASVLSKIPDKPETITAKLRRITAKKEE